ncbi:MAG: family 16 glycosylhydrolase [Eubacterium sp.]|nr:family 16 glycosylhydrolase [Eubacterium sp.]
MKTFRKGISILVALAMIVTICAVDSPKISQAGVKVIVGKKLNVEITDTETIVVKGKAKAKSANKKIAKVDSITKYEKNSNIHIKGMKVGKTTIKVKVGKSTKKIKVTVYPKTVSGVRAAKNSETSATVSWSKSKGAAGYTIYRSNNRNAGYVKLASKKGTSFFDSGLEKGKYYYYKVQAYGKKKIKSEDLSNPVYVRTWKQIWSDEFNGNAVNEKVWNYDVGDGGWGNRELQYYRPENNIVKDGKLIIKNEFQYDEDAEKCVDNSYFSGRMNTKGKFDFKYGKLEFRVKQAKGVGTWTAGWALGKDKVWPNCGEIDVFETTSSKLKQTIPQSLHCKKFNGMAGSSANKHFDTTVTTATSAYHTYGVIWTDYDITFTIDGQATGNYNPDNFVVEGRGNQDLTVWPYCQPFYLIVNCAIGGVLGGQVTPEYWTKVKQEGDIGFYEDYLYYDWIRVYQ